MNDEPAPVYDFARRVRASRPNRPMDAVTGIDASRRVAWARFYDELEHCRDLQRVNDILRERIAVLVPELLDLVDAVLTKRNLDAFAHAFRIRRLVDEFLENDARGTAS